MDITDIFDKIRSKAREDIAFRKRIAALEGENLISRFCKECNDAGIEVYPMDIADADVSAYAAMKRSTNGGGENSPDLDWGEDVLSAFLKEMRL